MDIFINFIFILFCGFLIYSSILAWFKILLLITSTTNILNCKKTSIIINQSFEDKI